MLIECTIRREKGSSVRFGETVYAFGPGEGPHVCEVNNPEHIRTLLAVTSSFRVFPGKSVPSEEEVEIDPIEGTPIKFLPPEEPAPRRGRSRRVKSGGNDQP